MRATTLAKAIDESIEQMRGLIDEVVEALNHRYEDLVGDGEVEIVWKTVDDIEETNNQIRCLLNHLNRMNKDR